MTRIHLLLSSVFVFLTLPGLLAEVTTEINVDDRWEQEGILMVKGEYWNARIKRGAQGVLLSKGRGDYEQVTNIIPFDKGNNYADGPKKISRIVENNNRITVEAVFHTVKDDEINVKYCFDVDGTISINPMEGMKGVRLEGEIKYGVLPGIFLEDIIYDPRESTGGVSEWHAPPEELFAALLGDGEGILLCTWPEGEQNITILLSEKGGEKAIDGIEITLSGMAMHTGLLVQPGIWHEVELPDDYRGRDIKTGWCRPFDATWRTEVFAKGWGNFAPRTAYLIPDGVERWWNAAVGRVERGPVWFEENDEAVFHLSGNFSLPGRRTFIYPLEGDHRTLMGFLERTPMAEHFTEVRKRKTPAVPPEGVPSVGYVACTGIGIVRNILKTGGGQAREQTFYREWTNYIADQAAGTQNRWIHRAELFQDIKEKIIVWQKDASDPETTAFLNTMHDLALKTKKNSLENHLAAEGYEHPEDYMKEKKQQISRFLEILAVPSTEFVAEYDYLVNQFNTWNIWHRQGAWGWGLREWFQEAGRLCRKNREAAEYAGIIRKQIRRHLQRRWDETFRL